MLEEPLFYWRNMWIKKQSFLFIWIIRR